MAITKYNAIFARLVGLGAFAANAHAGSLSVAFQATIASEQHPTYAGEARYYHVSVNPNNPGIGSYAATIVGTNNPAPSFVRKFTEDVVSYKWIGGTNNDIGGVAVSGGEAARITYATSDTVFDGYGQQQLKLWTTTDPGADLQTTVADPYAAVADANTGGYRSFGGAVVTVDISGLGTGSVYVFYGAFNATPSVGAVMRDTDGPAPDITIANAHLNGDAANRTEYYVAEMQFVNDAGYDVIEYTHLANGTDYAGNGRGLGTLLTGTPPAPAEFRLVITPNATPGLFDFQWNSQPGKVYDLLTSTDLATAVNSWPIYNDGVTLYGNLPATGTSTTLTGVPCADPRRFFALREEDLPPLLSESFDDDDGGFTITKVAGTGWAWGDPDSTGPGGTVATGNGGAGKCWGTDVGNPGFYVDPTTDSRLRSPVIDLTSVAAAELSFSQATDFPAGDSAVVRIINANTDTEIISGAFPLTVTDAVTTTALWQTVGPVSLPVGTPIRVEWCFAGTGDTTDDYLGWYIDDVQVVPVVP